jgi:hypothetical protein
VVRRKLRAETRIRWHDRPEANHYFSPRTATPERFWNPNQTFAADGDTRPKLRGRSVSSVLPCISFCIRAEGTAGAFQRGTFPNHDRIRKRISSKAQLQIAAQIRAGNLQHAWMNSRNQTTITSVCKHRQPAILHPINGVGEITPEENCPRNKRNRENESATCRLGD